MDKQTFIKILKSDSEKLNYRDKLLYACIENPSWMSILMKNMANIEDENSNFHARVFELVCKKDLELVIPYIDDFCNLLTKVKMHGVVRSCAKLCELMMIEYFVKNNLLFHSSIQDKHLEIIIEAGFNWMITDQKIAVQAYTMQTLYLLGTKYDWIHIELALILEKNIPTGSTGYKNRGRKVLKAIETSTKLKL